MNVSYSLGIIGLVLIIIGILIKNRDRTKRDILYIIGGIFLIIYSFYIQDVIFIILEVVFTLVSIYDLTKQKRGKK